MIFVRFAENNDLSTLRQHLFPAVFVKHYSFMPAGGAFRTVAVFEGKTVGAYRRETRLEIPATISAKALISRRLVIAVAFIENVRRENVIDLFHDLGGEGLFKFCGDLFVSHRRHLRKARQS
jgi:hypothetical protein